MMLWTFIFSIIMRHLAFPQNSCNAITTSKFFVVFFCSSSFFVLLYNSFITIVAMSYLSALFRWPCLTDHCPNHLHERWERIYLLHILSPQLSFKVKGNTKPKIFFSPKKIQILLLFICYLRLQVKIVKN